MSGVVAGFVEEVKSVASNVAEEAKCVASTVAAATTGCPSLGGLLSTEQAGGEGAMPAFAAGESGNKRPRNEGGGEEAEEVEKEAEGEDDDKSQRSEPPQERKAKRAAPEEPAAAAAAGAGAAGAAAAGESAAVTEEVKKTAAETAETAKPEAGAAETAAGVRALIEVPESLAGGATAAAAPPAPTTERTVPAALPVATVARDSGGGSGGGSHFIIKSNPGDFSIDAFHKDKDAVAAWDGVRAAAVRKTMREMRRGDEALFYHTSRSGSGKGRNPAIAGVVEVVREAYPDPTAEAKGEENKWVAVDLKLKRKFPREVPLSELKEHAGLHKPLHSFVLFGKAKSQSIAPVEDEHWNFIVNQLAAADKLAAGEKEGGGERYGAGAPSH